MTEPAKLRRNHRAATLNAVFAALADATRRSILNRLRQGPLTVTELARPYGMSLNAVSKHIKNLEGAGLVRRDIRGREHSCRLHAARMEEAMDWMSHYTEFWTGRLDALEKHLVEKRRQAKP